MSCTSRHQPVAPLVFSLHTGTRRFSHPPGTVAVVGLTPSIWKPWVRSNGVSSPHAPVMNSDISGRSGV